MAFFVSLFAATPRDHRLRQQFEEVRRAGARSYCVEEALVAVAIAAGEPVHRLPSAPPAAVLGVRIEAKVSRAA